MNTSSGAHSERSVTISLPLFLGLLSVEVAVPVSISAKDQINMFEIMKFFFSFFLNICEDTF